MWNLRSTVSRPSRTPGGVCMDHYYVHSLSAPVVLWFESVDIQFARHAGGAEDADVVAASAHVDVTVGNGWHRERDSKACYIGRDFGAVPQLGGQIGGIVGVEHRRAASWGLRGAVLARVQRPDYTVLRRCSRHRWGAAGKYE